MWFNVNYHCIKCINKLTILNQLIVQHNHITTTWLWLVLVNVSKPWMYLGSQGFGSRWFPGVVPGNLSLRGPGQAGCSSWSEFSLPDLHRTVSMGSKDPRVTGPHRQGSAPGSNSIYHGHRRCKREAAMLSTTKLKCGKNWKHIIVHYSNMSSNLPEFPAYHVLQSWTRVSPDWCSVPSEMLYRSRDEIGVAETLCKNVRNSLSARHGHSWSTNVHKKDIVRINYLFLCCMFWRSLFKRNLHHPE